MITKQELTSALILSKQIDIVNIMYEKSWRSIAKSISWRTVGTLDTMLISWLLTGNLAIAASIGTVEVFTKMALFFVHERAWNKINIGRVKPNNIDYQI